MELSLIFTKRDYNPETGVTVARVEDEETGLFGIGTARVHPDDQDLSTELTGVSIASNRAILKLLLVMQKETKQLLQNKTAQNLLTEEQKALLLEEEDFLDYSINSLKSQIKDYIADKDEAYKLIRKRREEGHTESFTDLGDLTAGMTAEQKQAIAQQIVVAATSETERLVLEGEND